MNNRVSCFMSAVLPAVQLNDEPSCPSKSCADCIRGVTKNYYPKYGKAGREDYGGEFESGCCASRTQKQQNHELTPMNTNELSLRCEETDLTRVEQKSQNGGDPLTMQALAQASEFEPHAVICPSR